MRLDTQARIPGVGFVLLGRSGYKRFGNGQ